MSPETILKSCQELMDKSVAHYDRELRGIRTGRATTALVEYLKVDYYGSPTELRELAAVSVPEPTQLKIKPFDPAAKNEILKSIETADIGLNPMTDGETIRVIVPPPSAERRRQLIGQVRKLGEETKVAIRNERREAIRHIDQLVKDKSSPVSEDEGKGAKAEVEALTKKHTDEVDEHCAAKVKEIEEV